MTRSIFDTNGFPYNVKIPFSFMTNRTSRLIRVGVLFAKIRLSWKISQKNNTEEGKGEKKGAIYPKEKNGVGLDFSVCLADRLVSYTESSWFLGETNCSQRTVGSISAAVSCRLISRTAAGNRA